MKCAGEITAAIPSCDWDCLIGESVCLGDATAMQFMVEWNFISTWFRVLLLPAELRSSINSKHWSRFRRASRNALLRIDASVIKLSGTLTEKLGYIIWCRRMAIDARCRIVALFCYILCLHSLAILFFTRGFLLTRTELSEFSTCSDIAKSPCLGEETPGAGAGAGNCMWIQSREVWI